MNNVAIYVDCDNLYRRLDAMGYHPVSDLKFFERLKDFFQVAGYNVIRYSAFADFTGKGFSIDDQTEIHSYGLEVYHCNIDKKNTTDAELMINAMKDLYEKPSIDVFVLVSNDRDYVPLIRAIKEKSKKTYALTTEKGTNKVVNIFTDYHQHIEELFGIKSLNELLISGIEKPSMSEDKEKMAGDVAEKFYSSELYKKYKINGSRVTLNGYADLLSRMKGFKYSKGDIIEFFRVAHELKFVELYEKDNEMCIREGEEFKHFLGLEVASADK